ncbi:MAG: hypothetical protein BroJett011_55110 [Chloroflexota bacterium]|nr:MAG: hypothetical protein BroJett011_55110 [Chloroflexota bacterium]
MSAKQVSPSRNPPRKRPVSPSRRGWGLVQRLHRRDLILLSGVLSLACVSVLVVVFLVLSYQSAPGALPETISQPGPQPTHTVTFVQITGLGQYASAQAAAQAWASDAQLVSANAVWPKVLSKDQVGEPTVWTYRFYSPAKARLFFVTVDPAGQLQTIEHVAPVTLPPATIAADSWLVDSPAALALWLDNGGAKMLGGNPGLELLIQLRSVTNKPNPVWLIAGLNNQTEEVHTVIIDANQGVVTVTQPGS